MRWMKLEASSRVKSERKTPVQYINAYIWNFEWWKRWPYMRDIKRDTDIKNRLLDSVGEGEGGMIWENCIDTRLLPYVKYMTNLSSMHENRTLRASGLGQPWGMGCGGMWEGVSGWWPHEHPWLFHINVWQKPLQYSNLINLQLKKKFLRNT